MKNIFNPKSKTAAAAQQQELAANDAQSGSSTTLQQDDNFRGAKKFKAPVRLEDGRFGYLASPLRPVRGEDIGTRGAASPDQATHKPLPPLPENGARPRVADTNTDSDAPQRLVRAGAGELPQLP